MYKIHINNANTKQKNLIPPKAAPRENPITQYYRFAVRAKFFPNTTQIFTIFDTKTCKIDVFFTSVLSSTHLFGCFFCQIHTLSMYLFTIFT